MLKPAVFTPQYLQFVIKISKFCNLRCKYCYEYPYLADPAKMSLAQIEGMLINILNYYQQHPELRIVDFIWHGGEPLLIKPEYYQSIKALQKKIFGPHPIEVLNKVQTNLTVLNDTYLQALKDALFDSIGVSIDLFGDDRVNTSGKLLQDNVLENMQILINEGVFFGSITVLTRKTYPHVEKIYTFFDDIQTACRFLPIYRTAFAGQHDDNGLSPEEIVNAFQRLFETWLGSNNAVSVDPIDRYISIALRVIQNDPAQALRYDKETSNSLFIVNTNGDVYSTDEVYEADSCFGNLFEQPLGEMATSPAFGATVAHSREKMQATCYSCEFFGACIGYEIAESTVEQMYTDTQGNLICGVIKPMIAYIKDRLIEENLVDSLIQHRPASASASGFVYQ